MRYKKFSIIISSTLILALILGFCFVAYSVPPEGKGQGKGHNKKAPAPVPQTGQATYCYSGDDGELQIGVVWPEPRFTNNNNGTVTDNLTAKVWLQNAGHGLWPWEDALDLCNSLADDGTNLTDGSIAGDWYLPNIRELQSLIDYGGSQYNMLPAGHPFVGLPPSGSQWFYWSSTALTAVCGGAWGVSFENGHMYGLNNATPYNVWCVRDGR